MLKNEISDKIKDSKTKYEKSINSTFSLSEKLGRNFNLSGGGPGESEISKILSEIRDGEHHDLVYLILNMLKKSHLNNNNPYQNTNRYPHQG